MKNVLLTIWLAVVVMAGVLFTVSAVKYAAFVWSQGPHGEIDQKWMRRFHIPTEKQMPATSGEKKHG